MRTRKGYAAVGASVVVLLALGAVAGPAVGKGKAKRTTFFLHGYERFGEQELPDMPGWTAERLWKQMDRKAPPDDPLPKSMFVTNGGQAAPNPSCSGNPYFPVWRGAVSGTVTGLEVELHTLAGPDAKLAISIFRDLETADCHTQDPTGSIVPYEYKPPMAVEVVEVPAGTGAVTASFDDLEVDVYDHLFVQVQIYDQVKNPNDQVRVLYDSSDYSSKVTFVNKPW